mmetsp:Transcript_79332/g.181835  ORF Transcript_79332/g.181835 Transcript_79332/m.181835 type:complete len:90 (-) Transcript_79332:2042-2311(-)
MGVKGLHKFLHAVHHRGSLAAFAGEKVGVDAMGWMHKGAFSCAYELMVKQETDGYIRYFFVASGHVDALQSHSCDRFRRSQVASKGNGR